MAHRLLGARAAGRLGWAGPARVALACALVTIVFSLATCRPALAMPQRPPQADEKTASPTESPTVVSLTFDDGSPDQYVVGKLLRAHNMHATFYIISGIVDAKAGAMSWPQIADLAKDGNDIGGHTLHHVNLLDPELSPDERRHEICDDRQRLIQLRFNPVSFAYPYGALDRSVGDIVRSCGYHSARSAGSVSPDGPNYAERIPPRNPYETWALDPEHGSSGPIRLAYLKEAVTAAVTHGGGWVQVVFHQVCAREEPYFRRCMAGYGSIDTDSFEGFLDWLEHSAPPVTTVRSVREVMSGSPTVTRSRQEPNSSQGKGAKGRNLSRSQAFSTRWEKLVLAVVAMVLAMVIGYVLLALRASGR